MSYEESPPKEKEELPIASGQKYWGSSLPTLYG